MATKNAKGQLLDRLTKNGHVIRTIDKRVINTAKDMGIKTEVVKLNGEEVGEKPVHIIGQI